MTEYRIVAYRGFGKTEKAFIEGHVFSKYGLKDPTENSIIDNFRQMAKRYRLKTSGNLPLVIQVLNRTFQTQTDADGLFKVTINMEFPGPGWYDYFVSVKGEENQFKGSIHISDNSSTAVLSDIDDTLLISHVNQMLKMVWVLMAKNALTRKPVPRIHLLYEAIKNFNQDVFPSDFFYVSNSEWNLYDFLMDFMQTNNIPDGVFFLQRLKKGFWDMVKAGKKLNDHKYESILSLFQFFDQKHFILVGDNGQLDLAIYSSVAEFYAGRIKGVIIRELPKPQYRRKNKVYEDKLWQLGVPVRHLRM
ncbi:MAG: DUF2183 domain-containing protein [Bacteroidales bacterium]|nr:DUF2183 domain-containing protein [Bacteroidales bacterium]MCF8333626.1 DUF2183 domain-containing protein [Bacteroidales bacterium]